MRAAMCAVVRRQLYFVVVAAVLVLATAATDDDPWEYRLAERTVTTTSLYVNTAGHLEYRENATVPWKRACEIGFNARSAAVACSSLGFGSNVDLTFQNWASVSVSDSRALSTYFSCVGSETALAACRRLPTSSRCYRSVWLACRLATQYAHPWEFRLGAVTAPARGRLEVRPTPQSTWGTVCDDSFGTYDAMVACRSLGLGDGTGATYYTAPGGTGPIWMDHVRCEATDANLTQCRFSYNTNNCGDHTEDIGVDCSERVLQFRLSGGPSPRHGRLELRENSTAPWGSVCASGFSLVNASAACTALGFPNSIASFLFAAADSAVSRQPTAAGARHITCAFASTALPRCTYASTPTCDEASQAVALRCDERTAYPAADRQWEYRLVPHSTVPRTAGTPAAAPDVLLDTAGVLQVRPNATAAWGTVCANSFGTDDAAIMCAALGYPNGITPIVTSGRHPGSHAAGPIWVDNLACPTTATDLANCSFTFAGSDCAAHTEDVSLDCAAAAWEFRLVRPAAASNASTYGRVELRPNASAAWGTVCADHVTYDTAVALCRDLDDRASPCDTTRVARATLRGGSVHFAHV